MIRAFDKTDKHVLRFAADDLDRLLKEVSDWANPGYDLNTAREELEHGRTHRIPAKDCVLGYEVRFYYDPENKVRDFDLRILDEVGLKLAYYPTFKY